MSLTKTLPDLRLSVTPVIICAPPASDAGFSRSQRMFANGRTDRLGLPRQLPSASRTVVMKGKRATVVKESGKMGSDRENSVMTVHGSDSAPSSPDPRPPKRPTRSTRAQSGMVNKVGVRSRPKTRSRMTCAESDSDFEMECEGEEPAGQGPTKRHQADQDGGQPKRARVTFVTDGDDDDDDDQTLAQLRLASKANKQTGKRSRKEKEVPSAEAANIITDGTFQRYMFLRP